MLQQISSTKRGGFFEYKPVYVNKLPIIEPSPSLKLELAELVKKILDAKTKDTDTTALEAQIDHLVYKLYGLTYGEVRLVDPEFGMGEEAYAAFLADG